jgi:ectoine hydroxylase-related dioxygenase (phytanoyl-CoA dioxygenase family)
LGYLIANWIAFEDIHPDSGPLEFYPRSHKLVPPLLSGELVISPLEYKTKGPSVYTERYEPTIRRYIEAMNLEPHFFMAKAGDVLFWHANLLHGGAKRKTLKLSRKALVCHYFAERVVTYHDLSGNPSRLHRNRMYELPVPDHAWMQSEYLRSN